VEPAALRAAFPGLSARAYLNAGTCGPLPRAAVDAATAVLTQAATEGRAKPYFETMLALRERQRVAYAARLTADPADVALTTSTSEGIVRVLAVLDLHPGDEVLTAPDEHPGLLGPLATLGARRGLTITAVPLAEIADAVGPRTRLVACSHVSWVTGALAPAALAALRGYVPVLLDGAQGIGAIRTDVRELGCTFYAAAGQKWLCGPIGTGMLWVDPAWRDRLPPLGPTYLNLAEPGDALHSPPQPDARRHDAPAMSAEASAVALTAHEILDAFGWDAVYERGVTLAGRLAESLRERGHRVAERGPTTLVSWEDGNPAATVERLAAQGVIIRDLPRTPYVRASVGAWNDEADLERLLDAL
jgi:selenocysteine lyase/cysteine desulfurase